MPEVEAAEPSQAAPTQPSPLQPPGQAGGAPAEALARPPPGAAAAAVAAPAGAAMGVPLEATSAPTGTTGTTTTQRRGATAKFASQITPPSAGDSKGGTPLSQAGFKRTVAGKGQQLTLLSLEVHADSRWGGWGRGKEGSMVCVLQGRQWATQQGCRGQPCRVHSFAGLAYVLPESCWQAKKSCLTCVLHSNCFKCRYSAPYTGCTTACTASMLIVPMPSWHSVCA